VLLGLAMERPSRLHKRRSIPSPGDHPCPALPPLAIRPRLILVFLTRSTREYSLYDLETIIAPLVSIPSPSLIIMHRSGWQVDESLLPLLLSECRSSRQSSNSLSTSISALGGAAGNGNGNEAFVSALVDLPEIFVFDRAFLDTPIEELLAEWEISERGVLGDPEVAETWSARELEDKALGLLSRIRNQRRAIEVALSNLDRHKEGKQGGVEAFEVGCFFCVGGAHVLITFWPDLLFAALCFATLGIVWVSTQLISALAPARAESPGAPSPPVSPQRHQFVYRGCVTSSEAAAVHWVWFSREGTKGEVLGRLCLQGEDRECQGDLQEGLWSVLLL
jgi:hypothetical protein